MLNRDLAAILLVLLICQLAGPAEASRDDIAYTQRRHKEEAPFEGVGQNIQEKLSEAAQQLVQSSLAQADVTRKVASNIDQYHNHVKSIASTMGEVMQARRALTTAYDEDLKRGEESRVGALEVNLPEVLGEDTKWKEEDFHGGKDLSDVGGTSSRLPQTPSGEVAASAPLEAGRDSNVEPSSEVLSQSAVDEVADEQGLSVANEEVSTPEIPGTPVSLSQLYAVGSKATQLRHRSHTSSVLQRHRQASRARLLQARFRRFPAHMLKGGGSSSRGSGGHHWGGGPSSHGHHGGHHWGGSSSRGSNHWGGRHGFHGQHQFHGLQHGHGFHGQHQFHGLQHGPHGGFQHPPVHHGPGFTQGVYAPSTIHHYPPHGQHGFVHPGQMHGQPGFVQPSQMYPPPPTGQYPPRAYPAQQYPPQAHGQPPIAGQMYGRPPIAQAVPVYQPPIAHAVPVNQPPIAHAVPVQGNVHGHGRGGLKKPISHLELSTTSHHKRGQHRRKTSVSVGTRSFQKEHV